MSTLLQRAIANSNKTQSRRPSDPDKPPSWPRELWEQASRDILAGTYKIPETRYPVIISPDSPISSPEKLQQLAGLETVPEMIETVQIEVDETEKSVVICHVGFEERKRIKARAEVLDSLAGGIKVWFEGGKRYAMLVKVLKNGITLEG